MKKIFFLILLLCYNFSVISQEIRGISTCVDSLVENIRSKTEYADLSIEIIDGLFVKTDFDSKSFKNEKTKKWISKIEKSEIKGKKVSIGRSHCYAFRSKIKYATGLAINFFSWMVIIPDLDIVFEFKSLSSNFRLIYFENGLRFYKLNYESELRKKQNSRTITYKIEQFQLTDNGAQNLIKVFNTRCCSN